jgi:hypothetical protein
MSRPDTIIIDGKPYSWRHIRELRKKQLEAAQTAKQPTLFPLREDARLVSQRSADGRYQEPTLFDP